MKNIKDEKIAMVVDRLMELIVPYIGETQFDPNGNYEKQVRDSLSRAIAYPNRGTYEMCKLLENDSWNVDDELYEIMDNVHYWYMEIDK